MGKTYFISDLHLQADLPETADIFSRFLARITKEADALYILGDFFETWIGDDDLSPFNLHIFKILKQATQSGLPVFFMRGNRDFLIGKKFAEMTGVQILSDPCVILLYGVRILLMHGDSLCTFDVKHQKMRIIMHNRFCQWAALHTPLSLRRKVGDFWRKKSRGHVSETNAYIMDVNPQSVLNEMRKFQVGWLIHGHTHRPGKHTMSGAHRVVLGAWHHQGNALVIDNNKFMELLNF